MEEDNISSTDMKHHAEMGHVASSNTAAVTFKIKILYNISYW